MVYEELKSVAGGWGGARVDSRQREVSSPEIIGMGALSKLAATVITYPSQVLAHALPQAMPASATVQVDTNALRPVMTISIVRSLCTWSKLLMSSGLLVYVAPGEPQGSL